MEKTREKQMASWCDEIILIVEDADGERVNDNGFENEKRDVRRKTVFCNKKSVGFNEFFKAQQADMTVSLKCDVKKADYEGEIIAEYEGVRYSVLKTYEINDDEIELTLSDMRQQGKKT